MSRTIDLYLELETEVKKEVKSEDMEASTFLIWLLAAFPSSHQSKSSCVLNSIVEQSLRAFRKSRRNVAGTDPTLTLFARWAEEDATNDPEEIVRRQRDGDELLTSLRENPLSLRRVDLPDEDAA